MQVASCQRIPDIILVLFLFPSGITFEFSLSFRTFPPCSSAANTGHQSQRGSAPDSRPAANHERRPPVKPARLVTCSFWSSHRRGCRQTSHWKQVLNKPEQSSLNTHWTHTAMIRATPGFLVCLLFYIIYSGCCHVYFCCVKALTCKLCSETHVVCDVTTASPFLSCQVYIPSIIRISKRIYFNFYLSIYTLDSHGTL